MWVIFFEYIEYYLYYVISFGLSILYIIGNNSKPREKDLNKSIYVKN